MFAGPAWESPARRSERRAVDSTDGLASAHAAIRAVSHPAAKRARTSGPAYRICRYRLALCRPASTRQRGPGWTARAAALTGSPESVLGDEPGQPRVDQLSRPRWAVNIGAQFGSDLRADILSQGRRRGQAGVVCAWLATGWGVSGHFV
jgi:hypothetical protein